MLPHDVHQTAIMAPSMILGSQRHCFVLQNSIHMMTMRLA